MKRLQIIYPDILPGQPKVIDFLMQQKNAYQKEIADGCLIEPPTLSLILEKMERVGLISRQKSLYNNKNIVVQLTEKGKTVGRKAQGIFNYGKHRNHQNPRRSRSAHQRIGC